MKECPACRRCFSDEINHCPQDGDATTPSLQGETILDARYQLERRLGQGGMGVVFQARHIFLKTSHAIKVILPDLVGNDPMLVTRFRQEALAAAAIRHQNIISVTDFGVVRGTMPFLVMEFVNGKSLQDILAEEKVMTPARALEFACAIGAGVAAAHRQNIVHRDLKPLNIMTQTGQPVAEGLKILDFGLAKIKSGELLGSFVQAKTTGMMGSPFYMAPEQWSDDEPDARADIYSLGIILYQMLAGDVPFKGSSIPSIMKKHLTLPPPSFASMGVEVAPQIEAVVRHALEKEVSARTPSVEAFIAELREAVGAVGASPRAPSAALAGDPNETIFAPASETAKSQQQVTSETVFDPAAKVSAPALSAEEQRRIAASRDAYEREQQERNRVAHEELAREAEARRHAEDEKERKRKELSKEREEREERERKQHEQMERVERQAKELEERLARLATSIVPQGAMPQTTLVDPEATQVHQGARVDAVGDNSFGGAATLPRSIPSAKVSEPAPKAGNSMMMIGAVVLVVLLVGGATAAYFMLRSKPITGVGINGNNPTPSPTIGADTIKADLIEIPGGTFQMGRNDGPADQSEAPAHPETVPSFFMDKSEVTNAEYAEFVRNTKRAWPDHWTSPEAPAGEELLPVSNVSFEDANAFASWRSRRDSVTYRLPTEQEWEYAARNGERSDLYPWGNDWKDNRAVLNEPDAAPVGSRPEGKNRWGVEDLIGNVWEWTSSKLSAYPGNRGQAIPTNRLNRIVFRGAGFDVNPARKEYPVSSCLRSANEPTFKAQQLGFRLVRSGQ